jgi:hypothetical protein
MIRLHGPRKIGPVFEIMDQHSRRDELSTRLFQRPFLQVSIGCIQTSVLCKFCFSLQTVIQGLFSRSVGLSDRID